MYWSCFRLFFCAGLPPCVLDRFGRFCLAAQRPRQWTTNNGSHHGLHGEMPQIVTKLSPQRIDLGASLCTGNSPRLVCGNVSFFFKLATWSTLTSQRLWWKCWPELYDAWQEFQCQRSVSWAVNQQWYMKIRWMEGMVEWCLSQKNILVTDKKLAITALATTATNKNCFERHHAGRKLQGSHSQTLASLFGSDVSYNCRTWDRLSNPLRKTLG